MKKIIFIYLLSFVITCVTNAQYIPFTNTTRIYDLDTGYVMKFYKVQLPQAGYKNFYIQRGGVAEAPYTYDMRYGNLYRYIYSANEFTDSAHNRALHNSWAFQYGYYMGYVMDFAFSSRDTNLLLYAYKGANWEPADNTNISFNNGMNVYSVFNPVLMQQCGGAAIDPVNDSIMYLGYSSNTTIGNLHKTTNRGVNWFCVDTIPVSIYNSKLFVNKYNHNTVFVSTSTSLYRSTTGGTDFQIVKTGVLNIRMYFDVSDNIIYLSSATADGFFKSTNNGADWTTILNKTVNDFEFDPLNSNIIYAGCYDGLYKSTNKGNTWTLYNNSFMPDINVKGIVKNPNSGDTLYAATNKAVYKVYGQSILDTETTKYFPLAVGNLYVYEVIPTYPNPNYKYRIRITKDTVVSGKRFFYCSWIFPGFNPNENWIRMDGVTGVISSLSQNNNCNYLVNEKYIDSLRSRINDTLYKCDTYSKSTCIDTLNNNIFGIPSRQKVFKQDGVVLNHRTYSRNFGLTTSDFWEGDNVTHLLRGCKINGVTYGDTLLTGIQNICSEIPSSFSLSQNYPNPFNPGTTIRYALPRAGVVRLAVYDVMGREVETLVNEKQAAGTYETIWDGTRFASGVYFYRLSTDRFSETRRMLKVK